jgi:hypothetical protein
MTQKAQTGQPFDTFETRSSEKSVREAGAEPGESEVGRVGGEWEEVRVRFECGHATA